MAIIYLKKDLMSSAHFNIAWLQQILADVFRLGMRLSRVGAKDLIQGRDFFRQHDAPHFRDQRIVLHQKYSSMAFVTKQDMFRTRDSYQRFY